MKTIKITIDKEGKPVIEAEGFTGGDCLKFTQPIQDALGTGVVLVEKTRNALARRVE
jgi:hypothetical protein